MTPHIWEFSAEADHRVVIDTDLDYFDDHFVGRPMAEDWRAPAVELRNKSLPAQDFVSWMLAAPVISDRARQVLEPVLGGACEILPLLSIKRRPYFAVNVVAVIDCLDYAESEI